jgi:hypothetical protein
VPVTGVKRNSLTLASTCLEHSWRSANSLPQRRRGRCPVGSVADCRTRRRVRVEGGVYRQPNGKYAACVMFEGKPRFRTVEGDLDAACSARARLAIAAQAGLLPACPRLTFATVAAR